MKNDYLGLENLIKIVVQECDCPFSDFGNANRIAFAIYCR